MSDTDGAAAAAGAAQSAPAKEPDKGVETKAADAARATATPPTTEPPKGASKTTDKTAEIEALRAQLDSEKSERAKLEERMAATETARASEAKAARTERRDAALERLGILPGYRAMAPDLDPREEEGRKALQAWADAHPEIRVAVRVASAAPPSEDSAIGKALAGKGKLPAAMVTRMLGGAR